MADGNRLLNFDIRSVFQDEGFKQAEKAMDALEQAGVGADLSMDELQQRVKGLQLEFTESGEVIDNMRDKTLSQAEAAERLAGEQGALGAMAQRTSRDMSVMEDVMDRINFRLEEGEDGAVRFRDTLTGSMNESRKAASSAQQQLQTFRFDMLSLMFAGMEASRVLKGLMNPAMEAMGVFDVWGDILTVFFLPVAQDLLNWVLRIGDFLLSLDDDTQSIINTFVKWAAVIFTLLQPITILILNLQFVVGAVKSVMAAVGALKIALGSKGIIGVLAAAGKGLLTLGGLVAAPIGAIALLVGAISGFALAWRNNWFDIRKRTGNAVQAMAPMFKAITRMALLPLEPLNQLVKAINRFTDRDLPTFSDATSRIEDEVESMGESMVRSGEQFEEATEKAPGEEDFELGTGDADISRRIGTIGDTPGSETVIQDIDMETQVDARDAGSPDEVAQAVNRRQREVTDTTFQGR